MTLESLWEFLVRPLLTMILLIGVGCGVIRLFHLIVLGED